LKWLRFYGKLSFKQELHPLKNFVLCKSQPQAQAANASFKDK